MIDYRKIALTICVVGGGAAIGCSGGQSTSNAPRALPPVPGSSSAALQSAAVSLTLTIPGGGSSAGFHKRPAYVSSATNSLSFSQNGGTAQTVSLVAGSPACTTSSGTRTCVVNINATPGAGQTFLLKLFASTDGSGTPLSAQTLVADVTAGKNNPIAATLNGVVSALSVKIANASLQYGQAASTNVVVNGLDASNQTIVGPGVFADANGNPITVTLADGDTTGSTALAQSTVTGPATIALSYNGGGVVSVPITASFGTVTTTASLPFVCGSASATSNLYVAGTLMTGTFGGSTPMPYVEGFGEFPLSESGVGVTPTNQVDVPNGYTVAVDKRGYAYTTAYGTPGPYVAEYCPGESGAAAPYRSYLFPTPAPSSSSFSYLSDQTVDSGNHVLALIGGYGTATSQVDVFAPDSGSVGFPTAVGPSPIATIAGSNTGFGSIVNHIAADPSGNIFVSTNAAIDKFPQGSSGNVAPATISDTAGGLLGLRDVKADAAGNVYALYAYDNLSQQTPAAPFGSVAVVEYTHGSYTTPARIITGANTQLATINGSTYSFAYAAAIALDPAGNIYVLNDAEQYNGNNTYTAYADVQEFTTAQNGNVAPASTFSVTGVSDDDLAVDGAGHVAVAEDDGYGILLYTNGAYVGQIPVSADVGLIAGIAYDGSSDLYVESEHYTDVNMVQHGMTGILTFTAPVVPNEAPSTVDPIPTKFYSKLAVDASKEVYGASFSGVDVYAAGDTSGTPARTITDGSLQDFPIGLGLDGTGSVYVAFSQHSFVDALSASGSGAEQPQGTYYDVFGSTIFASMAVDAAGNVYAGSCETNSVAVFPAGSSVPSRQIVGPLTKISCPDSLALDAATGNLYVANSSTSLISVFPSSANGNVAPAQTFTSTSTAYFDSVAIGPGFGSSGTSAIVRKSLRGGRYSLGLRSGVPAATTAGSAPTCPVSRMGVAADGRYPHAAGPSIGFARPGECIESRSAASRFMSPRLRRLLHH